MCCACEDRYSAAKNDLVGAVSAATISAEEALSTLEGVRQASREFQSVDGNDLKRDLEEMARLGRAAIRILNDIIRPGSH